MSYPPLPWGINREHRVVLHLTDCVFCDDWLEHYKACIDEDDPSLSDAIFDLETPTNNAMENMQDRIRVLEAEVRVANTTIQAKTRTVEILDEKIGELYTDLKVANDAFKASKATNIRLQAELARRDPRRRQRRSPSPIVISDDDSPPSLPPSAPGPAGPSRIQGEVDGRDRGNAPPVSLIVSPSTNPPPLYSSYLPFSDCFNSPTRRCDHHKGSPVAGRPHVRQAVGQMPCPLRLPNPDSASRCRALSFDDWLSSVDF
jgi:hypothetical protein